MGHVGQPYSAERESEEQVRGEAVSRGPAVLLKRVDPAPEAPVLSEPGVSSSSPVPLGLQHGHPPAFVEARVSFPKSLLSPL